MSTAGKSLLSSMCEDHIAIYRRQGFCVDLAWRCGGEGVVLHIYMGRHRLPVVGQYGKRIPIELLEARSSISDDVVTLNASFFLIHPVLYQDGKTKARKHL